MQATLQHASGAPALELKSSASQIRSRVSRLPRSAVRPRASTRPPGFPDDGVSEKDKVLAQFSRFAAEATTPLRSLISIPPSDVLQKQTQLTASELRSQAEQLRTQALQASAKLTASILSEEERSALLKKSNEALFSAAEILKAQSSAASSNISTLLQEAERKKGIILEAVKGAPEPVREIAETAVAAHSQEAAKKGAIIHDFCLGITYGGTLVLGGLLWFLITGSINAIRFGVFYGGMLLAAAVGSLKAWQAGKSSTPYIVVQAALSYLLFARETARYSATGIFFPTCVVAVASITMVAFYVYVVLAGGNPAPRKKGPEPPAEEATPAPAES